MSKRKILNGLPHDLTKSFFGTDKYCFCGYMSDWILNAAKRIDVTKITIDILNESFIPKELNFHPLTYELKFLKAIIEKKLLQNGFDKDFIIEAKIDIILTIDSKKLICTPLLIDKDGKQYEAGQIIEYAYENDFNPFEMVKKNNLDRPNTNLLTK